MVGPSAGRNGTRGEAVEAAILPLDEASDMAPDTPVRSIPDDRASA